MRMCGGSRNYSWTLYSNLMMTVLDAARWSRQRLLSATMEERFQRRRITSQRGRRRRRVTRGLVPLRVNGQVGRLPQAILWGPGVNHERREKECFPLIGPYRSCEGKVYLSLVEAWGELITWLGLGIWIHTPTCLVWLTMMLWATKTSSPKYNLINTILSV